LYTISSCTFFVFFCVALAPAKGWSAYG